MKVTFLFDQMFNVKLLFYLGHYMFLKIVCTWQRYEFTFFAR